jgi:hypothetical protein
MKVLVGPRADLGSGGLVEEVARALAGLQGTVVSLQQAGVRNLSRPLSPAEVAMLREAMGGDALVGYVCQGAGLAGDADVVSADPLDPRVRLVAVTDHANLTWRSPLTGPNDDSVGPRFPSMTGIYAPEIVVDRLAAAEGMIIALGIVAGVGDDRRLTAFEKQAVGTEAYGAASSELVPVAIVAAHMGLRVAAVVVVAGSSEKGDG